MHRRVALALVLATALPAPACIGDDPVEDPADDAFTDADGKADGYGLTPAEVAGVLALTNSASRATLRTDVGLTDRVAKNITAHRAGADQALGTADDDPFGDLHELDTVPYVGKKVFATLLEYARDHGYVHDDGGAGFCKTQHAGKTPSGAAVQICDAVFAAAPFVHVPADTTAGTSLTTYGGILNGLGLELHTADGRVLPLVDASGRTYPISSGPAGFKAPENMFAIYKVTGTRTTVDGSAALKLTKLEPVAWVPGAVQDKLLLGTWEAKTARRVGVRMFDETRPVTIRFTLSTTTDVTLWSNYSGGDGRLVAGALDNLDHAVTSASGACLPSLVSLGAGSPFYQPTKNRIALWRHPNMHGLNDQVVVMDYPTGSVDMSMNGMGNIEAFSPAALVATAGPAYADTTIYPHATPTGAKLWDLTKVTTGGASCP
jgi:hypothetical protein